MLISMTSTKDSSIFVVAHLPCHCTDWEASTFAPFRGEVRAGAYLKQTLLAEGSKPRTRLGLARLGSCGYYYQKAVKHYIGDEAASPRAFDVNATMKWNIPHIYLVRSSGQDNSVVPSSSHLKGYADAKVPLRVKLRTEPYDFRWQFLQFTQCLIF